MKDSHLKIFQLVAVQMENRPKTLQIRNIQSESGKNIFSILTILLSRLKVNWNWWEWIVHKHLLDCSKQLIDCKSIFETKLNDSFNYVALIIATGFWRSAQWIN